MQMESWPNLVARSASDRTLERFSMNRLTAQRNELFVAVQKGWRAINTDLWELEAPANGKFLRFLLAFIRTIVLMFEGFFRAEVKTRAAALTYKTFFAIVPSISTVKSFEEDTLILWQIKTKINKSILNKKMKVRRHLLEWMFHFLWVFFYQSENGFEFLALSHWEQDCKNPQPAFCQRHP